jgi:mono/diheme cytochrome c family protein
MRVGLMGFLLLAGIAPALAADVEHGRTIATRWCAECHVVAPDQAQAKADAPPFSVIAKTRTAEKLRVFLADPYPRMPNMSLSRDEIADLVGFIKAYGLAPDEKPEITLPQSDRVDREHRG